MAIHKSKRELEKQFVFIANELNNRFPDLDLRFNFVRQSSQVRFFAASISRRVHELQLGNNNPRDLIHQATFTLKEVAQIYDA